VSERPAVCPAHSLQKFRRLSRVFVSPEQVVDHNVALDEQQARRLITVLRKGAGQEIGVLDGQGRAWIAVLDDIGRHSASARIMEEVPVPDHGLRRVEIAVPPLKGEKMDLVLQKCTELGVSAFHLIPARRSVARMDGETGGKLSRYRAIVASAVEQCCGFTLPEVRIWPDLGDFLSSISCPGRYIAWEEEERTSCHHITANAHPCVLASGPEGGFETQEVALYQEHGFLSVSLGPRILRAETAPLMMAAVAIWGHNLAEKGLQGAAGGVQYP